MEGAHLYHLKGEIYSNGRPALTVHMQHHDIIKAITQLVESLKKFTDLRAKN